MRAVLLGVFLLVGWLGSASAQQLAGTTSMFYERGHGTQIEYLAPNGKSYLWYPGNRIVLMAPWRQQGNRICYRYAGNTYNPVTGSRGGKWNCMPLASYRSMLVEQKSGDVFGLAKQTTVPFVLPRTKTTIGKLARRAGK